MANPFDRFDAAPVQGTSVAASNPFDQFDLGKPGGNPVEEISNRYSTFAASGQAQQPARTNIDFTAPTDRIRATIAGLPDAEKTQALKEWGEARVKAAPDGFTRRLQRQMARGALGGAGAWLDELNAGIQGGVNKVSGGKVGFTYDEAKAYEDAKNRDLDSRETKLGNVGFIDSMFGEGAGDVTTGGLKKIAGGVVSAPLTPFMLAKPGASLLANVGRGIATGAGYGGVTGAGEGNGTDERLTNAVGGMAAGAVIGSAAPVVARGVGNVAATVTKARQPVPQGMAGYSKGAVERVSRAVDADGIATGPRPAVPETMLADMGPNLRGQAGALANQPGEGQAIVSQALEGRRAGAVGRIDAAKNEALWVNGGNRGRPNLVELEDRVMSRSRAAAKPFYDQFYNSNVPMTPELASALQRADAAGAFKSATKLTEASRPPRSEAEFYDYVKRAIDDMASRAKGAQSFNEHRIYSQLAKDLRDAVDKSLSPGNPAASAWAQARSASGDGIQFREALEQGGKTFAKSTHPDQLRADLARMSPVERTATVYGARGQLDDTIGNAATSLRQNGDTRLLQQLGSPYARAKAAMIAHKPNETIPRLFNRLDAEGQFADTYNQVTQNSKTAARQAAQKEFPVAGEASRSPDVSNVTMTGLAAQGARKIIDALRNGKMTAEQMRISRDAAHMLVQQGANRDTIIRGLMTFSRNKRATLAQRQAAEAIAQSLLQSAGARAVSTVVSGNDARP